MSHCSFLSFSRHSPSRMKRLYYTGNFPSADQGVPSYLEYNGAWVPLTALAWEQELNIPKEMRAAANNKSVRGWMSDDYRNIVLFTPAALYCIKPDRPLWDEEKWDAKQAGQMWCPQPRCCVVSSKRVRLVKRGFDLCSLYNVDFWSSLANSLLEVQLSQLDDGSWRAVFSEGADGVTIKIHWAHTRAQAETHWPLVLEKYLLFRALCMQHDLPIDVAWYIFGAPHALLWRQNHAKSVALFRSPPVVAQ